MGRCCRGGDVALPPDHADRDIDGARHDPDRAHHLLGADGLRDHGRPPGGDAVDVAVSPALYVAWFRVKEPADDGRERDTQVAAAT
jgi:hypothetical protein